MLDTRMAETMLEEFESRFGPGGEVHACFAPGRVNLIGEHTDYNGGLVLPIGIEQGTFMLVRESSSPMVRACSSNLDSETEFDPENIEKAGDWSDYVRGVFLYARDVCSDLPPFEALYSSNLPLGAGLSSSASLELATTTGLGCLGCRMSPERAVMVSRRAENNFVGVACGVMDQFAVAFARDRHAMLLDCDTFDYRQIPFNLDGTSLVVVNTGLYRSLADTPYNQRRRECEDALGWLSSRLGGRRNLREITVLEMEQLRNAMPGVLGPRALHVVRENIRVEEAAIALKTGDVEKLGYLMNRSHESMRDLFEISTPEIELLRDMSLASPGVWGCRLTGAGSGGCIISLVENSGIEGYLAEIPEKYWLATRFEPQVVVTLPAGGARVLVPGKSG